MFGNSDHSTFSIYIGDHEDGYVQVVVISIPDLSRRYDKFIPANEIAPLRPFNPTLSSRSDLRYVPTLRTFLLNKCFFIRRFGEPRLRFDLLEKASDLSPQSPGKSPRSPGKIPPIAGKNPPDSGDFYPRLQGFFPAISGVEKAKMCLSFRSSGCDDGGAHSYFDPPRRPDEVLDPLRRSEPCGIGRSFWDTSRT